MAVTTWTLIDARRDVYVDDLSLGPKELGLKGVTVRKRTLRGGLREGVDVVEIDNGKLRFVVLPQRGMGLWKAWLGDLEIGWQSPVQGPVHPTLVPLAEPSGLGWLEGFDELLCRCGLSSNGPPVFDAQHRLIHNLHGRIANLPAHRLELHSDSEAGELSLIGLVGESRFLFHNLQLTSTVTTRVGAAGLRIDDEVANLAGKAAEFQLLYHLNLGSPLLEEGSRLVAPVKTVVPRNVRAAEGIKTWDLYGGPQAGFEEQVYFFELLAGDDHQTTALLKNGNGSKGLSLRFDQRSLPHFILWKNTALVEDGYVTGLEPAINFPNPRPFEDQQGRVKTLAPDESFRCGLTLEIHIDRASVAQAEQDIATLQEAATPQIFDQPQPGWTA